MLSSRIFHRIFNNWNTNSRARQVGVIKSFLWIFCFQPLICRSVSDAIINCYSIVLHATYICSCGQFYFGRWKTWKTWNSQYFQCNAWSHNSHHAIHNNSLDWSRETIECQRSKGVSVLLCRSIFQFIRIIVIRICILCFKENWNEIKYNHHHFLFRLVQFNIQFHFFLNFPWLDYQT